MSNLGPRACAICGPVLDGCWRCSSKLSHSHVQTVDRHGKTGRLVAVCGVHGPQQATTPETARRLSGTSETFVKRRRDRERRLAQRRVLDRHAGEVAVELEKVRNG